MMVLIDVPEGYTGLVIALVSGLFGASFFMLAQLQARIAAGTLNDARNTSAWSVFFLRCLAGVGGAVILYFFFQTGLLEGSIWPDLTALEFVKIKPWSETELRVPGKEISLLIVWSFLAGYSERLVPSILDRTEARAKSNPS